MRIEKHFRNQVTANPELLDFNIEYLHRLDQVTELCSEVVKGLELDVKSLNEIARKYDLPEALGGVEAEVRNCLVKLRSEYRSCQEIDGQPRLRLLNFVEKLPLGIQEGLQPLIRQEVESLMAYSELVDQSTAEVSGILVEMRDFEDAISRKEQKILRARGVLQTKMDQHASEEQDSFDEEIERVRAMRLQEIEDLGNTIAENMDALEKKQAEVGETRLRLNEVNEKAAEAKGALLDAYLKSTEKIECAYQQLAESALGKDEDLQNIRTAIVNKTLEYPKVEQLLKESIGIFVRDDVAMIVSKAYSYGKADLVFSNFKRKMHFKGGSEMFRNLSLRAVKGEDSLEINEFKKKAKLGMSGLLSHFGQSARSMQSFGMTLPHLKEQDLAVYANEFDNQKTALLVDVLTTRRFEGMKLDVQKLNFLSLISLIRCVNGVGTL